MIPTPEDRDESEEERKAAKKARKRARLAATRAAGGIHVSSHRAHFHQPLNETVWIPTAEALMMLPEDPVIGIEVDGGTYAIPWWVMKNHHVANLEIGGKPFLITLCEVCSSSCFFAPVVADRRLTFEWTGHYNGTILICDIETKSLWAPFDGECIQGDLKGTKLVPFPVYQCYWQEWLALFPGSFVTRGDGEPRDGHGSKYRPTTETSGFLDELEHLDERLPPNQLVLGVQAGGHSRAYPLSTLTSNVLTDEIGGVSVAVFWRPGTLMALSFSPHVGGRIVDFEPGSEGAVRDKVSGEEWGWFGEPIGANSRGRLTFLKSALEKWYVWSAYHPATEIHALS